MNLKPLFFLIVFGWNNGNVSDNIIGLWQLENGIIVNIYKQNTKYYGDIVSLNGFNDGQVLDTHNPDKDHENDSLTGKTIIFDLEFNERDKIWTNGTMYAPHMGITANLEIKKATKDSITAVGSKFIFWHTEHWIRQ